MPWTPVTYVGVVAGILAIGLAGLVLAASRGHANRWLAALLSVEGLLQMSAVLGDAYENTLALDLLFIAAATLLPSLICRVLAPLDTPMVRWLRRRGARLGVLGVGLALLAGAAYVTLADPTTASDELESGSTLSAVLWTLLLLLLAGAFIFSLVASVSAFRRAQPGTAARARAKAFAIAFGARDAALGGFLVSILMLDALGLSLGRTLDYVPSIGTIAYVILLAYGILRTQLFDIDLKIKVGISKSTVVTLGLVCVLAAAKVAEFYLNKTFGFVAGGVAAGIMLVLAPRLNKLGDRVATAALPKATGSAEYIANRKLEVYRAAVETAWEDGNISQGDRAILDRLREKLEITGAEAYEVESDVARAMRSGPVPPSAAPA